MSKRRETQKAPRRPHCCSAAKRVPVQVSAGHDWVGVSFAPESVQLPGLLQMVKVVCMEQLLSLRRANLPHHRNGSGMNTIPIQNVWFDDAATSAMGEA